MRARFLLVLAASFAGALCGCSGRATRNIEKLLADLDSDSPKRRARAERNLAEHGRAAIKPLSSIVTGEGVEDLELSGDWKALRLPATRALGLMAARASLARSEAELAAKPLLEAVNAADGDGAVRVAAAKALGNFAQLTSPVNALILLLREPDDELATAAAESLVRNALHSIYRLILLEEPPAAAAGQKDWARLGERLRSTDSDIRLEAVRDLAASDDPRAAALLLQRIAGDKSADVRYQALRYCESVAAKAPGGAFAAKLHGQLATAFAKDKDSRVVLVAAQLLRTRQAELVGRFVERVERATVLCEKRLLADAASDDYDAATRSDAVNALARAPGDERDALLARLVDIAQGEPARIRRAAASVLASAKTDAEPRRLTETARKALGIAMKDRDGIVKLVAAQALGRDGDTEAVKFLVDLLSHEEAKIRTPAADALGTLGAKALDVLVGKLTESLANAGELAQWEVPLAKLRRKTELSAADEASVSKLEETIEEYRRSHPGRAEKSIAWGIVTGLGNIAGEIGDGAAPALDAVVQAAQCHYVAVRRAAANALASFGSEKAVGVLVAALKDPDETVRWHAAAALERRGASSVPALVQALGDDDTVALAASSLGRIGGSNALEPLLGRLGQARGAARAAVVWSIGELLRRHPASPQAAAARDALRKASQLADDPEAARLARYALARTTAKTTPQPQ